MLTTHQQNLNFDGSWRPRLLRGLLHHQPADTMCPIALLEVDPGVTECDSVFIIFAHVSFVRTACGTDGQWSHPGRSLAVILDILPSHRMGRDSNGHPLAFLFQRVLPVRACARPGLTASPQAATASPAANTFFAALMSRSWKVWHSGHLQNRSSRERVASTCPQWEHRLEDGYHLSILTRVRPYHCA